MARGMLPRDAYEAAGYRSRGDVAAKAASRLLKIVEIKQRIAELSEMSHSKHVATATEVKEAITTLLAEAKNNLDYRGFVALASRLSKMCG